MRGDEGEMRLERMLGTGSIGIFQEFGLLKKKKKNFDLFCPEGSGDSLEVSSRE